MDEHAGAPAPVWTPTAGDVERAGTTVFARGAAADAGYAGGATDYAALWEWSVERPAAFWRAVWEHADLGTTTGHALAPGDEAVLADDAMPGARWFPGVRLNYVQQVLRHAENAPDTPAIVARTESGGRAETSYGELVERVRDLAAFLAAHGVGVGDRVAGYLPDLAETVVAFLATVHLGATWAGCGQDYAPAAAAGRLAQLAPTVLVTADGYHHAGRWIDKSLDVDELVAALGPLEAVVLVARSEAATPGTAPPTGYLGWDAALAEGARARRAPGGDAVEQPVPVDFSHPLWVLFSSGTTGRPKGIVHGHGGVLLEHLKVLGLHSDLGPGDVFLWYTSLSWMMWNYQVAGLLVGATVLCYDGAPTYPDADALWRVVAEEGVALFGTSPGQVLASRKAGLRPGSTHDLSRLRTVGSTGSTLPADSFHWIHDEVGEHVQISSVSGGTDIVSAFVGGTTVVPVVPGELSVRYLGVALEAWRPDGTPVVGEVGEMVVTRPMPSMPVCFWDDPDGDRYRAAYFEDFPGVWRHGDWVRVTDRGSVTIHGRSDATLNRNGIRIGSADIYAVVEEMPEVTEAFVLGVDGPDGAYWMPLFVTLAEGTALDDELVAGIRERLRREASPRHVPDEVLLAPGIPHTRTGKKLEVPVTAMLAGRTGVDVDPQSVDRPELLDWYREVGAAHRW